MDDADVAYVLEQCDKNGDGVIDREELLPMLAKWAQIAFVKLERGKADAESAITERRSKNWEALKASSLQRGGRLLEVVASRGSRRRKL